MVQKHKRQKEIEIRSGYTNERTRIGSSTTDGRNLCEKQLVTRRGLDEEGDISPVSFMKSPTTLPTHSCTYPYPEPLISMRSLLTLI